MGSGAGVGRRGKGGRLKMGGSGGDSAADRALDSKRALDQFDFGQSDDDDDDDPVNL